MSYTRHTWVDNETITAAKLNNIEDGIEEAAWSGGGGYDIIIESRGYFLSDGASDYTVTGSILDCEDKVDAGEPISGLCILHVDWSYIPSGKNSNKHTYYLPLTEFEPPYERLAFGSLYYTNNVNNDDIKFIAAHFSYDASTGDLTHVYTSSLDLAP